ncbi:MAG: hypothetical protein Q4C47_08505, partial [Planctomycetia bacterium]|nr:hypothetical protein [Planctomycetia bacterium]
MRQWMGALAGTVFAISAVCAVSVAVEDRAETPVKSSGEMSAGELAESPGGMVAGEPVRGPVGAAAEGPTE